MASPCSPHVGTEAEATEGSEAAEGCEAAEGPEPAEGLEAAVGPEANRNDCPEDADRVAEPAAETEPGGEPQD